MANPSTAHEPSMEEILASIRQIISDEGEEATTPEPVAAAEPAPAQASSEASRSEPAGPALEPAARAGAGAKPAPSSQRQEPPPSRAPQPEKTALQDAPSERQTRQTSEPAFAAPSYAPARQAEAVPRAEMRDPSSRNAAPAARPAPAAGVAPLLSAGSDAAVSGSFSALAHTILAQNARTLEDLVSEMLRPMLQGWLDENLPGLVERLVKEEIDRVSRGRR